MTRSIHALTFLSALAVAAPLVATGAAAQDHPRKRVHRVAAADANGDRPLTIGRRRHTGRGLIQVSPTEVYAPGGFSAHVPVFRPNFAQRQELRKDARNQSIREATSGVYGYGLDGVGGTGFNTLGGGGYNNPNYGGSYNRYVGYNGVPTNLAFGPAFAFRHLTDHDPEDDDTGRGDDDGIGASEPSPAALGYTVDRYDSDNE